MATLPRPDVTVEQVFVEPAVALIPPALSSVMIGVNNQIEFRQSGGAYDHLISNVFSYPNLISGTTVDLTSVLVHLSDSDGVFELTSFTAATGDVTVPAFNEVERVLVRAATTGVTVGDFNGATFASDGATTISTRTFDSAGSTFLAAGIRPGQLLFIEDGADSNPYIIESVDSETSITVEAQPEIAFANFSATAATLGFHVAADYTTFQDTSVDFLKLNILPQRTFLRTTIASIERTFPIDRVPDANNLRLNTEFLVVGAVGTGTTTVATNTFTDTGKDFTALGVQIGWKLVITDGLGGGDVGTRNVTAVGTTTLTVDGAAFSGDTVITYRISETVPVLTGQTYDIFELRQNRSGTILISYDGARIDNVDKLVTVQTTADVVTKLGPATPENLLSFAAFWAIQNTDTTIFATAVPADTVLGFTSSLDFLETEEVYAMVPLTNNVTVHQLFSTHVTQQSSVDNKHERIVFINRDLFIQTTRTTADPADTGALITNNTSPVLDTFADATAGFVVDGIIKGDVIEFRFDDGLGGTITSENTRVESRDSATALTLIDGLTAGFITSWNTAVALGNADYNIKSAALDKFEQADFIADFSKGFANRRLHNVWPDLVEFTYTDTTEDTTLLTQDELAAVVVLEKTGDLTKVVDGTFLASAIGGQVAGEESEQPFTNLALTGPTSLRNANKYFTETQLDVIATGGTYIVIQDADDTPVFSRHQLSTDVTVIEKRELSITKNVDFIAKFFRNQLRPYIGKFNITKIYIEQLRSVASAIIGSLVSDGKLISGTIVKLQQDAANPDTVLLEVDILVPFPANFIRVTLLI